MDKNLNETTTQLESAGVNDAADFTADELFDVAQLLLNRSFASAIRIEHKMNWTHDRVTRSFEILAGRGILEKSDNVWVVVGEKLTMFLDGKPAAPAIPAIPAVPDAEPEAVEPEQILAESPAAVEPASGTTVKTVFAAKPAGITGTPVHKPVKSDFDRLDELLKREEEKEIPGQLDDSTRNERIQVLSRTIVETANRINSLLMKEERKDGRPRVRVLIQRFDADGNSLGRIKLLAGRGRKVTGYIWGITWENQVTEDWFANQKNEMSRACSRFLASSGIR